MGELYEDERITASFRKRFGEKNTLNIAEVAGFIGTSCKTVVRRFQQGEIAGFYHTNNRDIRLISDSVLEYMQRRNAFNADNLPERTRNGV